MDSYTSIYNKVFNNVGTVLSKDLQSMVAGYYKTFQHFI